MAINSKDLLRNLGMSTEGSAPKSTQKTIPQALKLNFHFVNPGNVASNRTQSQANAAGTVRPKSGAIAGGKHEQHRAQAALCKEIKKAQNEMRDAAKEKGVCGAVDSFAQSRQATGTLANVGTNAFIDAVSGGLSDAGQMIVEGSQAGGEIAADNADTTITPEINQQIRDQLACTPSALDWDGFYEAGYDAEDLMCLDPEAPNVPEYHMISANLDAMNNVQETVDLAGADLDYTGICLCADGICSTKLSNLSSGVPLDPFVVAKLGNLNRGDSSSDPTNNFEPSATHSFNPVA